MTWTYQANYRIGLRGGRVTRTYGGVRAFLAIAIDLMLGLVFGVVDLVFGVVGWTLRLSWHLLRLVFVAVREIFEALARFTWAVITLPGRSGGLAPRGVTVKPASAAFQEL